MLTGLLALRTTNGIPLTIAWLLAAWVTGCAAPPASDVVRIEAGRYHAAFDAAEEAARVRGLVPSVRDRRAGIIETDARIAPSLLEPGGADRASFEERLEHTVSMERIRARFEFIPATPDPPAAPGGGPDVLALGAPPIDLTALDAPLELRVTAFVEQAHMPGLRLTTWARRDSTLMEIVGPDGRVEAASFWTPVGRNRRYERRLLAAVARNLERSGAEDASRAPDEP